MASQLALFAVVVGIALLLAGIGFAILAFVTFRVPALVAKTKDASTPPRNVQPA
jgi:hypothetical protein